MARQQRFDWFLANQRQRKSKVSRARSAKQIRRSHFEPLELRNLLSVNTAATFTEFDAAESPGAPAGLQPEVLWASQEQYEQSGILEPAEFDARTPWDDQDPDVEGIQITFSYSNFLDGGISGGLTPEELIAATEEALGLWASVAPLDFIEVVDSGPDPAIPSDAFYPPSDHPLLRIGHHFIDGSSGVLAHAYFPNSNGINGDTHFDNGETWRIDPADPGFDVIEVMTHELGHALGLGHETANLAIMNPFYNGGFDGFGTGALLPDDIDGIQALYGEGEGGVTPLHPLLVDIVVDEDDGNTDEGDLSLREAIAIAIEGGGKQKIQFHEDLAGQTIMLDPALSSLIVNGPLILEGLGSSQITVEAPDPSATEGDGFQIFIINNEDPASQEPDTVAEVLISGLTLTGGDSATAGGAIISSENLTLQDVRIHDNFSAETGGAVYATGPLSLLGSSVENNRANDDGGGVHVTAGINVDSSALFNNHAGDEGGAIAAEGAGTDIVVTSSTLSGNTATGNGGAIHVIDTNPTLFRLLHSTVFQNTAGGTGGGVYQFDGVLAIEHSIVAGNTDNGTAPDIDNLNLFASPAVLSRYSLIGDTQGNLITELDPNLFDMDPQLGPLKDNGGPTLTHSPSTTSPALNAGNPTIPVPPEFDQRGVGFRRILEGAIDIGAVESGGFLETFTVTTLVDKDDITFTGEDNSPEDLSLREAISIANLQLGKNLINFSPSLNGRTLALEFVLGELHVSDSLTIDASDLTAGLTISGGGLDPTPTQNNGDGSRLLRSDDGDAATFIDVEIIGLTLRDGDVGGDGGAIHSLENLTLQSVSVLDSYAGGNGGGVYHKAGATGGTLRIESSTIAGNEAAVDGGGLWSNTNFPADPDPDPDPNPIVGLVINSTVSGNVAGDEGGGIINFDGQLELRHVTVTENQADHGSGVVSFGDSFTKTIVYSSIIAGNVINVNSPGTSADDTGFDVQRSRNVSFNSFESLGYNVVGVGDALLNFNNNDQAEVADPGLQSLGNFGGRTMTHALLPSSPAIDTGDPALPNQAYGAEVLANSPLLVWNLDETSGTTVTDAVGGVEGTLGTGVTLNQPGAALQTGTAVRFSGVDLESVIQTDPATLLATSSFVDNYSISLWFKADATEGTQVLLELYAPDEGDTSSITQLSIADGKFGYQGNVTEESHLSSAAVVAETWHHVVVVRQDAVTKIYFDGELDRTLTGETSVVGVDAALLLGGGTDGVGGITADLFTGEMDEVILIGTAISQQDAGKLFRSASTPVTEILTVDQRGTPFERFTDGDGDSVTVIDVGAFEVPAVEPNTDFDSDGDTDGADFLAWQRGFGKTNPQLSDGDANSDGDVDGGDLQNWSDEFGTFGPVQVVVTNVASPDLSPTVAPAIHRAVTQIHEAVRSGALGTRALGSGAVSAAAGSSAADYFNRASVRDPSDRGLRHSTRYFAQQEAITVFLSDTGLALVATNHTDRVGLANGVEVTGGSSRTDASPATREPLEALDTAFERLGLGRLFGQD